ncbi:hypothetical protein H696_05015 [Fonticula alba]|uniref:Uncharacterized protein n=1 Tax=Fonticula alba TaxID=691883 RepID=A0A058Z355_FONAL|nr:hypothetical protein H696_05015 [Fonticula alba]KCV68729.1 hypothetical protein H696_05015 [Fonticula alba]|eukprot:XP_009497161.1 hypothetical protein H696_05015 [Fonticula alba]
MFAAAMRQGLRAGQLPVIPGRRSLSGWTPPQGPEKPKRPMVGLADFRRLFSKPNLTPEEIDRLSLRPITPGFHVWNLFLALLTPAIYWLVLWKLKKDANFEPDASGKRPVNNPLEQMLGRSTPEPLNNRRGAALTGPDGTLAKEDLAPVVASLEERIALLEQELQARNPSSNLGAPSAPGATPPTSAASPPSMAQAGDPSVDAPPAKAPGSGSMIVDLLLAGARILSEALRPAVESVATKMLDRLNADRLPLEPPAGGDAPLAVEPPEIVAPPAEPPLIVLVEAVEPPAEAPEDLLRSSVPPPAASPPGPVMPVEPAVPARPLAGRIVPPSATPDSSPVRGSPLERS